MSTFNKGRGWILWGSLFIFILALGIKSWVSHPAPRISGKNQKLQHIAGENRILNKKEEVKIAPEEPSSVTSETERKLATLREILVSGNDNDRRIDQDLNVLNPETKAAFRSAYEELPLERRNSRGLVVFLLGRTLERPEDFDFIRAVLSEPACLSLGDCRRSASGSDDDDGSPSETLLNYPQAVALESIANFMKKTELSSTQKIELFRTLEQARRSSVPVVASKSRDLLAELKKSYP
jgi:hypothetical protein